MYTDGWTLNTSHVPYHLTILNKIRKCLLTRVNRNMERFSLIRIDDSKLIYFVMLMLILCINMNFIPSMGCSWYQWNSTESISGCFCVKEKYKCNKKTSGRYIWWQPPVKIIIIVQNKHNFSTKLENCPHSTRF